MDTEQSLINIMREFELKHNDKMESLKIEQTKIGEVVFRIEEKLDDVSVKIKNIVDNDLVQAEKVRCELEKRELKFIKMFAPHLAWDILRYTGGVVGAAIIITLLGLIFKK